MTTLQKEVLGKDAHTCKKPFGIQWHITDTCDQRCKHCYIYSNPNSKPHKGLPLDQCILIVNKFLDFCNRMECRPSMNITGGDPLLYPNIWQLLEYIHEKKIPFSILGNPFHLSDGVARKLKSLGCKSYQMSLDGLKETHDFIRKKGSFDATVVAIQTLKQHEIKPNIMTTVSKLNSHEIPDLAELATKLDVSTFTFARYCPTHKDTKYNFTPHEYKEFLSIMWERYSQLADKGTRFTLKDHLWKLFLFEKGLYEIEEENLVMDGCHCAISHMTVLSDGQICACRRFESKVGNILEDNFVNIFLNEKMMAYRNIDKMENCGNCELLNYCRGCHAVSAGTYGNFFRKDPQCWKFC